MNSTGLWIIMVLSVVLFLASCSNDNGDSGPGTSDTGEAVPTSDDAEKAVPTSDDAEEAVSSSEVEQVISGLEADILKMTPLYAKRIREKREGKVPKKPTKMKNDPESVRNSMRKMFSDPEFLNYRRNMSRFVQNLQSKLGISTLEFEHGPLLALFVLEPVCRELTVDLSSAQSQKLRVMKTRLIRRLLQVKKKKTMLEVGKSYERLVVLRRVGRKLKDFLTKDQKDKLGQFGESYGNIPSLWLPHLDFPRTVEQQVETWKKLFGIAGARHKSTLTSTTQAYLASYGKLRRKYGHFVSTLTDRQIEEREREMVEIEVKALKKILQLELTLKQRERVIGYDLLNQEVIKSRREPFLGIAAEEEKEEEGNITLALRTLWFGQTYYKRQHGKYAETLEELQKEGSAFSQVTGYTLQMKTNGPDKWSVTATPSDTSKRHYRIEESGLIRWEKGRPANANSPVYPIGR